jgi:hypothetical protein
VSADGEADAYTAADGSAEPGLRWTRTAGRLLWLLSPTAPIPRRPPRPREARAACWLMLETWQVLPATWPRFRQWGNPDPRDPWVRRAEARSVAVAAAARLQNRLCSRIAAGLERSGVPYVLLKSTAARMIAYPESGERGGMDVDFGVRRADLDAARRVLAVLGLEPAEWNVPVGRFQVADPLLRAAVEARHYELGFLVRRQAVRELPPDEERRVRAQLGEAPNPWHTLPDGGLGCWLVADVHHGITPEIPVDPLIDSARSATVDGVTYAVPRSAWLAFHLIYKIYWEGVHSYRTGLYQYADLCRVAAQLDAAEVGVLRELLSRWSLEAAGYYVLRRLPRFGAPLSPELVRMVNDYSTPGPDDEPVRVNDLGDMWYKLWGRRGGRPFQAHPPEVQ